jgi:hypothetical protein
MKITELMTKLFLNIQQHIIKPMAVLLAMKGANYWPLHWRSFKQEMHCSIEQKTPLHPVNHNCLHSKHVLTTKTPEAQRTIISNPFFNN